MRKLFQDRATKKKANEEKDLLSALQQIIDALKSSDMSALPNCRDLPGKLGGKLREVVGAIHERRRLDDEDAETYRLVVKALDVAMWDTKLPEGNDYLNPDMPFTWSQDVRDVMGFPEEKDFPNVLSSWSTRVHPDDIEMAFTAVNAHLSDRSDNVPYDIEHRLKVKSGEYRWFRTFGSSRRDEHGNPRRLAGALIDIDQQVKNREQSRVMSKIVQHIPDFVSYKRLDGKCEYINPSALAMTGYSQQELLEDYIGLCLEPDERERVSRIVADGLQRSSIVEYEAPFITKDGRKRVCRGTSFLIDEDSYASVIKDVTEAKEAEIRTNDANKRIELMLNTSPMCTQIWSKNGSPLDCNDVLLELFGFDSKQEYLETFKGVGMCSPELQPNGKASAELAVEYTKRTFQEGYFVFDWIHIHRRTGVTMPCEITLMSTTYNDQEVMVGYTRDMREYHNLLNIINVLTSDPLNYDSAGFTENLLGAMETVGNEVNVGRICIFRNQEVGGELYCSKIFGWTFGSSENQTTDPFPFPEGIYSPMLSNKCISGPVKNFPEQERARLELQGVKSAIMLPIYLYNEFWGFVSFKDVYKERIFSMMEESIFRTIGFLFANSILRNDLTLQLVASAEDAMSASRSKSAFLANMSHEIRTPMNVVLGVSDILMQSDDLPPNIEDGLDKIYSSCELLINIINDILDFSKVEAGKLDISPFRYKTSNLINDTIQLNLLRVGSKPICFDLQINENLPAEMIGDALRIKQILNNLLSNAFKYTDSGTVVLSVDFEPDKQDSRMIALVLKVKDTGYGLTKRQLDRIFDEYSRFAKRFDRTIEGTGLGLTITQGLIKLMEGEIYVESEPGKGSVFTVTLPQKIPNGAGILGKEEAEHLSDTRIKCQTNGRRRRITREPMPYGRVLVVDDVETNRYVAVKLMELYDLELETAANGLECINKAKDGKTYDIIFMDHMMPGLDGIETTKQLRALGYTEPIVALTANAVIGQEEVFLQNGMDAFISKPIDAVQLDSILNRMIRSKQPSHILDAVRIQYSNGKKKEFPIKNPDSRILKMQLDGINIAKGFERYNGDEALYLKVLRSYANNVRSMLELVEEVNPNELLAYKTTVHGIKGASLDIFAGQIAEMALSLEKAATSGNLGFISERNPVFLEAAMNLVHNIDRVIELMESENAKPEKPEPDKKMLKKLLEACKAYDMDGADAAMEEIEKYSYQSDDGLAEWLRDKVSLAEFDQIADKLSS
ncbi:MAG: PAS domain-containing protein [Oscillospiraceae bacterium]|nr:PAS domain-containing protein [Oscillospiraceae bacterium]